MGQTEADRQALMDAIKVELRQRLWSEPGARPTFGRYLSLFILNAEPMWVYDVKTLQILDVNEAALRRYGYAQPEFLALTALIAGHIYLAAFGPSGLLDGRAEQRQQTDP